MSPRKANKKQRAAAAQPAEGVTYGTWLENNQISGKRLNYF